MDIQPIRFSRRSWGATGAVTAGVIAVVLACSSANFGANSKPPANSDAVSAPPGATPPAGPSPTGPGGTPTGAPPGSPGPGSTPGGAPTTGTGPSCSTDKVALDWTGPEKTCIDSGQTWDFNTNVCQQIRKASFDCTWANAITALDAKGLTTPTVKADSAAGAKLVSCGQSQDGNRIVIQWIKVSDGAASVGCTGGGTPQQHHVTTGCYTYYADGNVPAPATTQAESDARVYACLGSI